MSAKRLVSFRLAFIIIIIIVFKPKNLRSILTFVYSRFGNSLGIVKTTKILTRSYRTLCVTCTSRVYKKKKNRFDLRGGGERRIYLLLQRTPYSRSGEYNGLHSVRVLGLSTLLLLLLLFLSSPPTLTQQCIRYTYVCVYRTCIGRREITVYSLLLLLPRCLFIGLFMLPVYVVRN